MMLSQSDQEMIMELFALGPTALLVNRGMSSEDYLKFVARKDISDALNELVVEFRDNESLTLRRQFIAKRQLAGCIPMAVSVLRKALSGPTYLITPEGRHAKDMDGKFIHLAPEVTNKQLDAAKDVLSRLGVVNVLRPGSFASMVVQLTYGESAVQGMDIEYKEETKEAKKLSRDRMRRAMSILSPKIRAILPALDEEVDTVMTVQRRRRKQEKKKRGKGKK